MPPPTHPTKEAVITYFVLVVLGVLYTLLDHSMANRNPSGHSPRYWRRHPEALLIPNSEPGTEPTENQTSKSAWQRFFDFVEQPMLLATIGILGGIVGVILFAPVFLLCDIAALLALHRSRAVADKRLRTQVFWYGFVFVLMTVVLFEVGILLRSRSRQFTRELAQGIADSLKPDLNEAPDLSYDIWSYGTAAVGPGHKDTLIDALGTVLNRGAPSIARDWNMSLDFGDSRIVPVTIMGNLDPDTVLTFQTSTGQWFHQIGREHCPQATSSIAIEKNGGRPCFVYAIGKGMDAKEVQDKNPWIIITFYDVTGKKIVARGRPKKGSMVAIQGPEN
jgi:hypothetical protein